MTSPDNHLVKPVVTFAVDPRNWPSPGLLDTWSLAMREQALRDIALIERYYPGFHEHALVNIKANSDAEDFWENTARTAAAIRAALNHNLEFVPITPAMIEAELNGSSAEASSRSTIRLGPILAIEEHHRREPLHPLIAQHGGRWMALCGYSSSKDELPPEHDITYLALLRAELRAERELRSVSFVVKATQPKAGIGVIRVSPGITTAQDIHNQLSDIFGWTLVREEGRPEAFLLQDGIEMQYEYRLFVVNGKIIAGAGCIEEFTPYDRDRDFMSFFYSQYKDTQYGIRLSNDMRRYRGNGFQNYTESDCSSRQALIASDCSSAKASSLPSRVEHLHSIATSYWAYAQDWLNNLGSSTNGSSRERSSVLNSSSRERSSSKDTFVLDVALTTDLATGEQSALSGSSGEPSSRVIVIEINSIGNSGLYASDVDAVYSAIVDAELANRN